MLITVSRSVIPMGVDYSLGRRDVRRPPGLARGPETRGFPSQEGA